MGMISVILPTYNERRTLPEVLRRLHSLADALPLEVVVVDDASPDGTAQEAALVGEEIGLLVHVLSRPGKLGLATAVLEGARRARGDFLVIMDGDGSHPPEVVPSLVAGLQEGADVAVASRYVGGGGISRWPLTRRAVSLAATAAARILFGLRARDPLSGFFAARRHVFDRPYWGIGFKVLLEILVRGSDLRVVEVPYTFVDRKTGESKLSIGEVRAYLRLIMRLLRARWQPQRERSEA